MVFPDYNERASPATQKSMDSSYVLYPGIRMKQQMRRELRFFFLHFAEGIPIMFAIIKDDFLMINQAIDHVDHMLWAAFWTSILHSRAH